MDAGVGIGRNPVVSKHQINLAVWRMSRVTRDGTAKLVSRDQILRRERGQGNVCIACSAEHEQDWQRYPVDPYSAIYIYMCVVCMCVMAIHGRKVRFWPKCLIVRPRKNRPGIRKYLLQEILSFVCTSYDILRIINQHVNRYILL